jgi:hypothetical protein
MTNHSFVLSDNQKKEDEVTYHQKSLKFSRLQIKWGIVTFQFDTNKPLLPRH